MHNGKTSISSLTSGALVKMLFHTSSSQLSITVSALTVAPFARPTRFSKSILPPGLEVPAGPFSAVPDRSSKRCESRRN